jgi:hypothetical protein
MLTVTVDINGRFITKVHAVRIRPKRSNLTPDIRCTYDVFLDGGKKIGVLREHRYGDGAEWLAGKILRMAKPKP